MRRLLLDSFVRFRYADGFSHSRALAFQVALSVVPFLLALSGLAADIDHERPAAGAGPHHRAALPRRRVARRAGLGGDQRPDRRAAPARSRWSSGCSSRCCR